VNLTWDQTELEAVQADVEGFDIADFGFDIEDLPQVVMPTGEKQGEGEELDMNEFFKPEDENATKADKKTITVVLPAGTTEDDMNKVRDIITAALSDYNGIEVK